MTNLIGRFVDPRALQRCLRKAPPARHKRFTLVSDILVYFGGQYHPLAAEPYENTSGLPRQYLPQGIDLLGYSQVVLNAIARASK